MGGEDLGPHAKPSWACSAVTPWWEQVVTRNEQRRRWWLDYVGLGSVKHVELVENDEVNFRQLGNIINISSCTTSYHIASDHIHTVVYDNGCIHVRRAPVTTLCN